MTIERSRPTSDALCACVEDYAQRKTTKPDAGVLTVFPTMRVELLFHFGDPFMCGETADGPFVAAPRAAILHARAQRAWQRAGPSIDWFLVGLTPLGCRRLLGAPLRNFTHAPVDLAEVWGVRATQLHEALRAESLIEGRWRIFRDVVEQMPIATPRHETVLRALGPDRLSAIASAGDFAAEVGLSPRRARQVVQEEMGVGLKTLLAVQRLSAQLEQLHAGGRAKLKRESAHEFADQSHASREFKRATGMTQRAYARGKQEAQDTLIYTAPSDGES